MDFIQQNLMLVILVATSGAMLLFNLFSSGKGASVSSQEATTLINREDAQVLDVREAAEFASGHLLGALNIPQAKLSERLTELEKFKGKPIIVCCETGVRSARAVTELSRQGFERVVSLQGGLVDWSKAGLPLNKKGGRKS